MKLKMLVSMAGSDFALSPDDVTDRFSADEAGRLIEAGFAAPAADAPTEKAVKNPAPEKRGK